MRPKMVVLVAGNEARCGSLRFLLATWGYAVRAAETAEAAAEDLARLRPHVLVVAWPMRGGAELLDRARAWPPATRTIAVAAKAVAAPADCGADAIVLKGADGWLRECVAGLAIRRKGRAPAKEPARTQRVIVTARGPRAARAAEEELAMAMGRTA